MPTVCGKHARLPRAKATRSSAECPQTVGACTDASKCRVQRRSSRAQLRRDVARSGRDRKRGVVAGRAAAEPADRWLCRGAVRRRGGAAALVRARARDVTTGDRARIRRPRPRRRLAQARGDDRHPASRSTPRPRRVSRRPQRNDDRPRARRRGAGRAGGAVRLGARTEAPRRPLAGTGPAARTRRL
jgi:hypothetical protein